MTPERIRAIAERCAEDMGAPEDIDCESFIAAAIETALEEAGRPVGVDLRDRFAMAALPEVLAQREICDFDRTVAANAYAIADEMLAARGKR